MMEVDEASGVEALKKKAVSSSSSTTTTTTTVAAAKSRGHVEGCQSNGEAAASPEGNGVSSSVDDGKGTESEEAEVESVDENGDTGGEDDKMEVEDGDESANGVAEGHLKDDDAETEKVDVEKVKIEKDEGDSEKKGEGEVLKDRGGVNDVKISDVGVEVSEGRAKVKQEEDAGDSDKNGEGEVAKDKGGFNDIEVKVSEGRTKGDAGEEIDDSEASETEARSAEKKSGKAKADPASDDTEERSGDSETDDRPEEKVKPGAEAKDGGADKKQTIIITETKSLAKAIHDAAREPDDGKPTLVIIESKSSGGGDKSVSTSSSSAAAVSEKAAATTTSGKTMVRSVMTTRSASNSLPASHNSLRSALLQGSSVARGQVPAASKQGTASGRSAKSEASQGVALQDDAEVSVYTPSLVVPYLFECPPKENLADFVAKIAPPPKKVVKMEGEEVVEEVAAAAVKSAPGGKNFFESALGAFFVDIGLSQVQQWVQSEILKAQKRKLDRGWKTKERESIVSDLQKTLGAMKARNKPFQFKSRKCSRCNFVTESKTVLDRHLETIHVVGHRMQCSFCQFDTLDPSQIFQHLYSTHKAFGRLERPPTCHMCPLCPFEDSGKARVTRHTWKCQKTFAAEKNLAPTPDWEPPAKRTRHVASVATLKALRGGGSSSGNSPANASSTVQGARVSGQLQQMARVRPSIVPKPSDVRLTPAYVQSVLRGQYMQQQTRGTMPSIIRGSVPYAARGQLQAQQRLVSPTAGAYILPRQQVMGGATTLTPVTPGGSATAYLQGNQLYQVVRTSVGPVLRNAAPTASFTPPRFTILPTAVANTGGRSGPTPVALIPNLATTGSGTPAAAHSSSSGKQQVYPVSRHGATPTGGSRLQPQLGAAKPNISITPVANKPGARLAPVTSSSSSAVRLVAQQQQRGGAAGASSRPVQPPGSIRPPAVTGGAAGAAGANPSYVVCEICDGYIKDLDQLRNHMQWIHKVKIHPKMIHNRPPLNCQKCHYRFFTDQGLERHLLGSHGLVTSSMQENANKGKDGGRCTICGKVFLWKLVVHMAKDHRMTLKPAHLSYKCTVCSATFNMYRLFETHVYEEHSTVAKRVLDGPNKPLPAALAPKGAVTAASSSSSKPSPAVAAAAMVRKEAAASASPAGGGVESRIKSCVECGVEFRCTENCLSHIEKNHLKAVQIKLCRVDKCQACSSKKGRGDAAIRKRELAAAAAAKKEEDDEIQELTPPAKRQPRTVEVETLDDDDDQGEPTENGKAGSSPAVDPPSPEDSPAATSSSSKKKSKDSSDVESPSPPAKRARLELSATEESVEPKRETARKQPAPPPAKEAPSKKSSSSESTKVKSEPKKVEATSTRKAEAVKKPQHSDDDDNVFDMEVETVDEEEVQSDRNTDVESD